MELTREQLIKAGEHISQHWPNGCLNCGNKSLSITDYIYAIPLHEGKGVVYPLAPVYCHNCGRVDFCHPDHFGITGNNTPSDPPIRIREL